MSKRGALALLPLLVLAACHRGNVADVTLDADRAAENATAAKTLADIAMADQASSNPLPPGPAAARSAETEAVPDAPDADEAAGEGNGQDVSPQ